MIHKIVYAELPDPVIESHLQKIVTKCIIREPCGSFNPYAPCMDIRKCMKNYPKYFRNETVINFDGYPSYTRRELKKFVIDNRNIVPYNKYFSLKYKYNEYINVEVCTSIKSVKYIFKYIYKGYYCINVVLKENQNQQNQEIVHDEVNNYLEPEAI